MGTIRKNVLAVCMAVLLAILGMTVSAARQSEAGNEENMETLSGGDAAGEQVMPYVAGDIASDTDSSDNIDWVIDVSGRLTVTGTGDLAGNHSSATFAWKPYSSQITSAVVNVTGMTDASYLFSGCENMVSLDVRGLDTSNVTDMRWMFEGCSSLTNLDVSTFDTSNVTNMWWMFKDCKSLLSLDVSNFNTSNVTDMEGMFSYCRKLSNLDVSRFDTSSVTKMNEMFLACNSLTGLDLSTFRTTNVGIMEYMFSGCSSLVSLDISGFDTSNVAYMAGMFESCNSLTSLDLSVFDVGNVTGIENMLRYCIGLTTIQSPRNLSQVVMLPDVSGTTWSLPDGTEITELPQGVSTSVTLTRSGTPEAPGIITTTPDLNMSDVIRVKYVPYSYTVETNNIDPNNTIEFSVVEGRLANGLQMHPATGEIYGVPTEAGEFKIMVMATYSNPAYLSSYAELTLTVLDNTDGNVGVATDPGYNITQPVTGFSVENIAGNGTQTLVSQGEYSQFRDVYIDGKKLTAGQDYTSEAGSTRITIMNQTLADGGTGTHTLGIEFRTETGTLKRAAQNYVISSKTDTGSNTGNNNNSNSGSNNNNNGNANNNSDNNNGNNSIIPPVAIEIPQPDFTIYTVERGDSLWDIAVKFYGRGESWRKIYNDNVAVIKNPNRLYAGQKLVIRLAGTVAASPLPEVSASAPAAGTAVTGGTTYIVQKGDMLWSIAQKVYGDGKLWKIIYEANKGIIASPEVIRAGQVLSIPQR